MNLQQTHPLYDRWWPTWRLLGDVYEGAGGFLDGSHLIPHPRELRYKQTINQTTGAITVDDTQLDPLNPETEKFRRRRQLARYENFAAIIVDTLLDYMYAKQPARAIATEGDDQTHPIRAWWQNVDGQGTHIDDWMKLAHVLAFVYGHVFVAMDRPVTDAPPLTRADQPQPFLRVYTPLDALDWLAPAGRIAAVKFVEAVGRDTLDQMATAQAMAQNAGSAVGGGSARAVQYRVWTAGTWQLFDQGGQPVLEGAHQMGEAPVVVLRGRPRATVPVIGRSGLGDPKLYVDHYNLISEKREIERAQTFSILNVPLKDDQAADDAQTLMGRQVGTTSVLFTREKAAWLTPEVGPLEHYERDLEALERKIYRLVGLPWEGDSRAAESAESRRIKALDLNRLLAGMADEAERVEYALARLWCLSQQGPVAGQAAYDDLGLSIKYPDEFQAQEVLDVLVELRGKVAAGMGKTFNTIARKRALPVLAPDLSDEQRQEIEGEIESTPLDAVSAADQFRADLLKAANQNTAGKKSPADEGAGASGGGLPGEEGGPS